MDSATGKASGAALSLAYVLVALVIVLLSMASFGGVDAYYFMLYGRDLAQDPQHVSEAIGFYFPGGFLYNAWLFRIFAYQYRAYQSAHAIVLLLNAGVVAAIVSMLGNRRGWSLFAAGSYLWLILRLDGAEMTTEPLATLPFLTGLALWVWLTARSRHWTGLLCFGVGIGLAAFFKQQGALLSVGAAGLLIGARHQGVLPGRRMRSWIAVPAAALASLGLAYVAAGFSIGDLSFGMKMAATYAGERSMIRNVGSVLIKGGPLLLATGLGALLWWKRLVRGEKLSLQDVVWTVGLLAMLGGMVQLSKRAYLHYGLLLAPFACLVVTFSLQELLKRSRWRRAMIAAVAGLMLLDVPWMVRSAEAALTRGGPRHEEFGAVCSHVLRGRKLLLLPSRQNGLHWQCHTHARSTKWGYTFNNQEDPVDYASELGDPELLQVFVFDPDRSPYARRVAMSTTWSVFFDDLEGRGFRRTWEGEEGALYTRSPVGKER